MNTIVKKTFGGLTKNYYYRQLFFGLLISTPFTVLPILKGSQYEFVFLGLISALLYPYSRFLYETIVDFIVGDNRFSINSFVYIFFKLQTMALCLTFAIAIAPIGLVYLYYYHSKNAQQA